MKRFDYLKFNDVAPDLDLVTVDGGTVRLSSLWMHQTTMLAFIRHFGCPQCKEMLEQLVGVKPQLESAGISLALITQGQPDETREFCRVFAPGLTCYCDPERKAYKAYKLRRGALMQTFLSPRVWAANARAKRKGYKVELPPQGQDSMQLAGIFVVGVDGRIRLPFYYDDIADHPPLELLLKGFLETSWTKPFDSPITGGRST